jgi:tetratricopeptide (TPR) repeat protein
MKSRFSVYTIVLIPFIITLSIYSSAQPVQYSRKVDKSTIFYLFKNKGFGHLNTKLEQFQKEYEENYLGEDNLYSAFDVFSKADASFEPILHEWVKQFPASAAAYTARSKYYCACAWQVNGNKWTIDRYGKEYEEMERYFSLALADITEALKQNIRSDVCYAMKIEIGMATDKEGLMNNALVEALTYHPYAYRVRLQYLQALTPRWGGTYQKMEVFIDSCKKYIEYNPKLKELTASIPADKGMTYAYLGKYEHAMKMYTEALKSSSLPSYYVKRGDAYAQMRNYKSALADYEQALNLSPNDPEYLDRKTSVLSNVNRLFRTQKMKEGTGLPVPNDLKKGDQSLISEKQKAIEHTNKGSVHLRAGRHEEAIAEYSEAIRLSPGDYVTYYYRAGCYQQLGNNEAALQDLISVVERKPDEIYVYLRIMRIYADRGMYDDALNYVNKVISLDPANGEAFFNRSKIYERKGSNIEAIEDMRHACDMGYDPACRSYKQIR